MRKVLFVAILFLAGCTENAPPLQRWAITGNGAFAGDVAEGQPLAAISSDNQGVIVVDLRTGKPKYRLQMNVQAPSRAALSRDGFKPDDRVADTPLPVSLLRFSENGDYLVTADQTRIALWQVSTGENLGYWLAGHYQGKARVDEPGVTQIQTLRDVAVSNGGNFIAFARADGVVEHVNRKTGRRIAFLGHHAKVNSIAMSENGFYVLSGGNDHQALLWSSKTGQVIRRFPAAGRVVMVAMTDDGRYALVDDVSNQATIWDLRTGEKVSQLATKAKQELFTAARFSSDGSRLITGGAGRALTLWDVASGKRLWQRQVGIDDDLRPRSAVVYGVGFANDKVFSVSSAGLIEAWPLEAPK